MRHRKKNISMICRGGNAADRKMDFWRKKVFAETFLNDPFFNEIRFWHCRKYESRFNIVISIHFSTDQEPRQPGWEANIIPLGPDPTKKIFSIKLRPGLVIMGGDLWSRGHGFNSRILDGQFSIFICCKNCTVCLKRPNKIIERPGMA